MNTLYICFHDHGNPSTQDRVISPWNVVKSWCEYAIRCRGWTVHRQRVIFHWYLVASRNKIGTCFTKWSSHWFSCCNDYFSSCSLTIGRDRTLFIAITTSWLEFPVIQCSYGFFQILLFSFSVLIACVSVRLRVQQLEIKPPHFAVFDHLHHFAWVESQAIPSKVLNVIVPSSSRSSNWSSPVCLASKACLGSLSWGILLTWPNHLSWDRSIRRSNGSMLRDFRISELRTLINSVTPSIRRKKPHFGRLPLWSHSYGHYLWFMTISENEEKNCFENWGLCFFWRC